MSGLSQTSELKPIAGNFHWKTILLLLALFLVLKAAEQFVIGRYAVYASDLTTDNILNAVNQQRGLRNLALLNTNDKLSAAAQYKAGDMMARKYFSHTDPEGNYIWPKIVAEGYAPYSELGENLAIEFYDTDSLIAAWMNSPTHRANILQENFKDQGGGLSFGDSSLGQYHSAIANTFGALLMVKPAAAPQPSPKPAPAKKTALPKIVAPKTVSPLQSPAAATSSLPVTETKPTSGTETKPTSSTETLVKTPITPIEPRYSPEILATNPPAAGNKASSGASTLRTSPAVLPPVNLQDNLQPYQINHYFTLAFGMVLLLFLMSDAKKIANAKLQSLDKKMNNLVLLLISLIVIAFMYWL